MTADRAERGKADRPPAVAGAERRSATEALRKNAAVMAQRTEAADSLDDFPTPPWAVRALFEAVFPSIGVDLRGRRVWEPACNRGLMAFVIAEYAGDVRASDVHDYGFGEVGSFVGDGPDVAPSRRCDAVITNPPFRLSGQFLLRARKEAPVVALLVRTAWLEGVGRYEEIFAPDPPAAVAVFCERVPMVKGGWSPGATSATSYSWVVWAGKARETRLLWIPPGQRARLSRPGDVDFARERGALREEQSSEGEDLFK